MRRPILVQLRRSAPATPAPFVLTGLTSRGGLSNWVFFFFPEEIVQCDLGVVPAVKAGAEAGIRANLDVIGEFGETVYGPRLPKGGTLEAWHERHRAGNHGMLDRLRIPSQVVG